MEIRRAHATVEWSNWNLNNPGLLTVFKSETSTDHLQEYTSMSSFWTLLLKRGFVKNVESWAQSQIN